MAFENVKTNQQQNNAQPEQFASYVQDLRNMMARIEHRAMRAIRKSDFGEFASAAIIDPYAEYHPSDAMFWLDILSEARKLSEDMYARLYYVRGGGTVLVPDVRFGFVFEPIIGEYGWASRQFYDQEVQCLNEHAEQIMNLVAMAAQPF
ncbi:MAG: hypothetical protein RR910_08105 [Acidaminococcaceae bacterium]